MSESIGDQALLRGFEAGTLAEFHHRDHVRAAWLYLKREPLLRAVERFSEDLRAFARAQGRPGLYHETLTWAFLFLVHERLGAREEEFEAFASRNADLMCWKPSALDRYYQPETLASERARRSFMLPDRLAPA